MQVHEGNLQELALIISMVVENLCLSSNNNEELVYCLKVQLLECLQIRFSNVSQKKVTQS
jgi:hypothetical protein